jgi:predicted O-methyltransferase YrrM
VSKLYTAYKYLIYRLKSVDEHGVHSPFVFELTTTVIYNKVKFYNFQKIEELRGKLLQSSREINLIDLGAGSAKSLKNKRKVSEIALHSAKSPKYAQLLFRLANYFQPKTILELGTSLGISTSYLASVNSESAVFTIEGSEEIAEIAKNNFQELELTNIRSISGNFDSELPLLLERIETLDFVFFDGNHRKEPTLNYFEQCLKKATEKSVFVFDDIYWSKEMTEAWEEIKKNERVSVTIDLFFIGIVFFRKEQAKQHFVIKF